MLALADDDVELDAVAEGADEDLAQAEADERRQRTVRHRRGLPVPVTLLPPMN